MSTTQSLVLSLLLVAGTVMGSHHGQPSWTYHATSGIKPGGWYHSFPACGGNHQSPVDLHPGHASFDQNLCNMTFSDWHLPQEGATISNNGHSVTVAVPGKAFVEGGGLPGRFQVAQFHFHWGASSRQGSEHRIGGHAFPAELHIVMWNTRYADFKSAVAEADGLAVLGVMLQEAYGGEVRTQPFQSIQEALDDISEPGSPAVTLSYDFTLWELLPGWSSMFRYSGSLTTPPCHESVTWTVYREPLPVTGTFLSSLRGLRDEHGAHLVDNYRPVQPMHGRHLKFC